MKNLLNAKKLSRDEMKSIIGGETQAECYNKCADYASAQCSMQDPFHVDQAAI